MAFTFTPQEKVRAKTLLGIPATSTALDEVFAAIETDAGVYEGIGAEVRTILTAYGEVFTDADELSAEGLDANPERTRRHLRRQLAPMLGWSMTPGVARG
jgi:hypothetical protein